MCAASTAGKARRFPSPDTAARARRASADRFCQFVSVHDGHLDVGNNQGDIPLGLQTIEGVADAEARKAGSIIEDDGSAVDQIVKVLADAKVI